MDFLSNQLSSLKKSPPLFQIGGKQGGISQRGGGFSLEIDLITPFEKVPERILHTDDSF